MLLVAAIACLAGAGIGLRLDVRMIISAVTAIVLGCLLSATAGWTGVAETVLAAAIALPAMLAGYVSARILYAFGMIETAPPPKVPDVSSPSASDNP